MKNNYMKWLNKATASILMLAGLAACADTWDEHYEMSDTTSTKTLWEQIQDNDKLKDFARILENVHYYDNENKRYENYTYKDLLSGTQTLTVWAPEDGTYDAEALLQQCQQGSEKEYKVEHEFIRNHINRFRTNVSGEGNDSLTMFSNKMNILYRDKKLIRDAEVRQSNIAATNGVLHTISAPLPFQMNLLEYFYAHPGLSKMQEFFQRFDTTYIDPNQSTQGPIVNDEITYVDEVWTTDHQLLNFATSYQGNTLLGLNARLQREDSLYAMILLTDPAWEAGLEKVSKLFKYRSKYKNQYTTSTANNDITVKIDSLQEIESKLALIRNVVFNARTQENLTIDNFGVDADSLVNTIGNTLYSPVCNEIFDGKTPEKVSNGYAYVVDNFRFDPTQTIKTDISVEASYSYSWTGSGTTSGITYLMNELYRNPDVKGSFGNGRILYVMAPGLTNPTITYRIPNVMSGKYAIKVVFPPSNVLLRDQGTEAKPYKLTFTMKYYKDAGETGNSFTESQARVANKIIEVDNNNLKNDTVTLDLVVNNAPFTEFPVCYYGVNNAAVTLEIKSNVTRNEADKYSKNFYIDEIIFESKED
ncbi:MAG: hypothetical protein NC388_06540 [Clostridium sp.]|nr:hypothetical protein [Clostridium sp.]